MPQQHSVKIVNDLRPAYYDEFHCLAADCRTSCCKDWRIPFSRRDYLNIKKQKGSPELNQRMEHSMRRIRNSGEDYFSEFALNDGICPFLDEDCLCLLQKEKGHDVLPKVCKVFPRSETYRASGYLERSLSTACEGVLTLLWDLPDGIDFRSDSLPERDHAVYSYEKSDLRDLFQNIRSQCIDFLQDRRFSLPERILLVGMALKFLVDGETDFQRWRAKACALFETTRAGALLNELDTGKAPIILLTQIRKILGGPIHITIHRKAAGRIEDADWLTSEKNLAVIWQAASELFGVGRLSLEHLSLKPYLEAKIRYEKSFEGRDYFMENLMVSLFFHLGIPDVSSLESLWKSYVNFCNLYAFHNFAAVLSCREGVAEGKDELFRLLVCASRVLIHNRDRQAALRDEFFQNNSATLAHMAILLGG